MTPEGKKGGAVLGKMTSPTTPSAERSRTRCSLSQLPAIIPEATPTLIASSSFTDAGPGSISSHLSS